jgi:hypothetical protein
VADAKPVSPQRLRALFEAATSLPKWWVGALVLVALGSMVDLTVTDKGPDWHFSVGPTTLVAVALIWLPTAVRLLALAGGSVKAGGLEASSTGLMQAPERFIEDLTELRANAARPSGQPPDPAAIESGVDRMAARYLPAEETLSPAVLDGLAREYERLRRTMSSGDKRTTAMSKIVNEVRVRAAAAPESARRLAPALLRSEAAGDRVVGLALVQGNPTGEVYADVLHILTTALSPFEQYQCLVTLGRILPDLDAGARTRLQAALELEKTDPRGLGVMKDTDRASWIDHLLTMLRDPVAGR